MIGAIFYQLGEVLAGRLPVPVAERVTEQVVALQYAFRIRSRRIIAANLRIVLGDGVGDEQIQALTRRVFSNFGRSIYSFLRLPHLSDEELDAACDYNGLERVVERVARGRACIFVGPHLGSWEVGGACLSRLGVPIVTVALPHPSAAVTRFFNRRRADRGIECVDLGSASTALRRALGERRSVALLSDRVYSGKSARFRWFDTDVDLPLGPAALAVRSRVPIVTMACVLAGGNRFRFVFGGPHHPDERLGLEQSMMELQRRCIEDMTTMIQSYPDQWFHFHRFGRGGY